MTALSKMPAEEREALFKEWVGLCAGAGEGPWRQHDHPYDWEVQIPDQQFTIEVSTRPDAAFIAASRTAMPALLAEVRRLEARLAAVEAVAREMAVPLAAECRCADICEGEREPRCGFHGACDIKDDPRCDKALAEARRLGLLDEEGEDDDQG